MLGQSRVRLSFREQQGIQVHCKEVLWCPMLPGMPNIKKKSSRQWITILIPLHFIAHARPSATAVKMLGAEHEPNGNLITINSTLPLNK